MVIFTYGHISSETLFFLGSTFPVFRMFGTSGCGDNTLLFRGTQQLKPGDALEAASLLGNGVECCDYMIVD